ncbi:MAG: PBP1A family penicillin-binding protein [SAR324 cluster bacterium]|nr:PBP1A family penicillin-binding protein [SAR324 cluster bacterium]
MKFRIWLIIALSIPVLSMVSIGWYALYWYPRIIHNFEKAVANIQKNTIIYDRYGKPFYSLRGEQNRLIISQNAINRYLKISVLAAEDARFLQHRGVNALRILAATWINLREGQYLQGASTITQQLSKITLLNFERSLTRKFKELFIALALEIRFSKSEILEYYLNAIYLGHGNYGVEQASLAYFQKHAAELTLGEAALLAGIIKKPETYLQFPESMAITKSINLHDLTEATRRQSHILKQLLELGWITPEEYQQTLRETVIIHTPKSPKFTGSYFVQQILNLVKREHKLPKVSGGGYQIYTTIDPVLQKQAETVFEQTFKQSKNDFKQGALVSLEPHTGYVRALVGGKDFEESEFNRATQARRQPGSSFKPFVFATALEQGFTPNSTFSDEPLSYEWEQEDGTISVYEPRNYDRVYGSERSMLNQSGEVYYADQITLSKALEKSINSIAVQLLYSIGTGPVLKKLNKMNFPVQHQVGLCLALGCSETTLLDISSGYSVFANQGQYLPPVFITRIEQDDRDVLYQYQPPQPIPVFSAWTAHQMKQIMKRVILYGTGKNADWPNNKNFIAGKTGTTSEQRDAWFIGFSNQLVTGVWIGNDDNQPMSDESGSRSPAEIWMRFMKFALNRIDNESLWPETPHRTYPTCTVSGDLARKNCPDVVDYDYPVNSPPVRSCGIHSGVVLH